MAPSFKLTISIARFPNFHGRNVAFTHASEINTRSAYFRGNHAMFTINPGARSKADGAFKLRLSSSEQGRVKGRNNITVVHSVLMNADGVSITLFYL